MSKQKQLYRKNFLLILVFLVLISASLIVALTLAYNLSKKYVENEFSSQKIEVLERTIKPYNDFFQNTIPEISFYQGFLDSASVVKYVDTVFTRYSFVENIIFYDTEISNHQIEEGFKMQSISIAPKAIYQFGEDIAQDSGLLFKRNSNNTLPPRTAEEFNKVVVKFSGFIESLDTARALNSEDIFRIFYSIASNRITYMNIPRREDLSLYKDLMNKKLPPSPVYQQDVLSFNLNPSHLNIINTQPNLYQYIAIQPLVYESLENNADMINTDIPLPGAFANYKLYLSSSKDFLNKEKNRRFLPIAISLVLIYSVLVFIAYLIFRNLNINSKMFKLQYDFINNLTHEFKTPVSVIKIAGNNIRSASQLSDSERKHYGKILDEEADKLNDLMNKLLSFTQIENKAIVIKYELINLEIFCQNIVDSYQIKYPHFSITYQIKGAEYFKTDPVLLGSIFQNLIDNAYKYSEPENKFINISIKKLKKKLLFRFADKGIGIPEPELANIFKKFYRIESQYNQQGSVGLGLAFCKELINFMNGTISVKSKVRIGSEFIVELPLQEELKKQKVPKSEA